MKMNFNIHFEADGIIDYLDKLEALANDKSNIQNFLRDAGYDLHRRYIRPIMPKWNPNLVYSPLEPEHQIFEMEEGISSLELLYTGFTRFERAGKLRLIFKEFAVNEDIFSGHLERDYAFFQETGIDHKVSPNKYKPTHLHFVERGTKEFETEFHYKTMAYLDKLMHLERWDRVNPNITLYDYE